MWSALDSNGNGIVSLAEVDRWIVNAFPLLDHKPALMRAFVTATKREGDGDDWIERKEFVTVCCGVTTWLMRAAHPQRVLLQPRVPRV